MQTNILEIYKCHICGNSVQIISSGVKGIICCNEEMELLKLNNEEASLEKHIPIINITNNNIEIQVGEILHPMTENHYIEWIEIRYDNCSFRKFLKPGDEPKAIFDKVNNKFSVIASCNLHGLWESNN